MKLVPLVPVAPPAVTDMVPVIAPGITIATSAVLLPDTTIAAAPPMVKAGLSRLIPVIVISVPTGPIKGVKEVIMGVAAGEGKAEKGAKLSEPIRVSVVVLKKVKSCKSTVAKSSVPLFVFLLRVNSDP